MSAFAQTYLRTDCDGFGEDIFERLNSIAAFMSGSGPISGPDAGNGIIYCDYSDNVYPFPIYSVDEFAFLQEKLKCRRKRT
tara:strand:+ start:260 stop:502 length:243 start_codon:yes stop_codon:yes gene_type:complete